MRRGAAAIAILATALVAGSLSAPPAIADRQAAASRPLIKPAATETQYFSPNGDRRQDRAGIAFKLTTRAKVKAVVKDDGVRLRGPVRLGKLAKGRHVWKWDGRTNSGKVVSDGSYRVVLTAVHEGRRQKITSYVAADTDRPDGRLISSRPSVYPKATIVDDHVRLHWVLDGWNPWDEEFFPEDDQPAKVQLRITSRFGDVVWRRTKRNDYTPVFDWYGVRNGKALRAGRYTARVTVTDEAGNRRRDSVDLSVSHKQLLEQTWTTTIRAGQAQTYVPHFGGCNGCPETCGPAPSERFADGLSFRPCPPTTGWATIGYFGADVPLPEAPVDTYRITAAGGPTTPGGADEGSLLGSVAAGEGTTTTSWFRVQNTGHPYLPQQDRPVIWRFSTSGSNSYDVATFTIDYHYYLPAG
jgi:hypothetical protein